MSLDELKCSLSSLWFSSELFKINNNNNFNVFSYLGSAVALQDPVVRLWPVGINVLCFLQYYYNLMYNNIRQYFMYNYTGYKF